MSKFFQFFQQVSYHCAIFIWVGTTIVVLVYMIFFLARYIESFLPVHNPETISVFNYHKQIWKMIAIAYVIGAAIFFFGIFLPILIFILLTKILWKVKGLLISN